MCQKNNEGDHNSRNDIKDNSHPSIVDSWNQVGLGLKQIFQTWSLAAEGLRNQIAQIAQTSVTVQQAVNQKAIEIRRGFETVFQPIVQMMEHVRKIDPAFLEAIKLKLEQLVSDKKRVHSRLALRGWFLIASDQFLTMRDMIDLTLLLETEDFSKIDDFMTEWIETKLSPIQKILIESYPSRREILERAFQAHNSGDYLLSVPVFLAQADGIWIELTGSRSVYSKKKGKPRSLGYIERTEIQEELLYLFEPFRMITPLSEDDDQVDSGMLNRHAVLHGKSCDYGTKLNSLKSISWLFYVGTFMEGAKR